MSQRFFSDEPITGDAATVTGPEAHHLLHVMRLGVGDRATLFDGTGVEFAAEVTAIGRRDVTFAILDRRAVDRESPVALSLGVALPKGDRQKTLVEKLTELGATRLTPVVTERSVAAAKGSSLDKLRRLVIEASKQCGRNRLMEITEPLTLEEFFRAAPEGERLIACPGVGAGAMWPTSRSVAVLVGPEGGFSEAEVAAARDAGWRSISLGERVLRVETAAIAIAARCCG